GDPACDTADLDDAVGVGLGNLRLDYALAGRALEVLGGGVFWPGEKALAGAPASVSPHHLVWVDVRAPR
ncbi:MAG: endonuclease/exonuclease/phosphatase family protein, partial [Planctomycetes bacterium]|nr:endonuclease/exonuclease/phosphatase family protein [Planctomycetota bacterium]